MIATTSPSYSSQVQIRLHTGGIVLSVAQVGEDSLILREPRELSPADGTIVVSVDGIERRFQVRILEGSGPDKMVRFSESSPPNQPVLF